MASYKDQYERYYGNVRAKAPGRVQKRDTSIDMFYGRRNVRKRTSMGEKIANKFIFQLVASLTLLIGFFVLKMIPIEGAKEAYIVSKEAIDKNFDINKAVMAINIPQLEGYKENALDYIEQIKSKVTGKKTLKEVIKEEYITPVVGEYKKLEGENIGLLIMSSEGKDVMASFDGTVREVKEGNDGKHIVVDHGNGVETYYGLLSNLEVKEGDEIKKGQVLGKTGSLDEEGTKGIVYKLIYMGMEKDPTEILDFSNIKNV